MDPISMAVASALVGAMSTDAWPQVQAAMVEVWRRALPEETDAVEAELAHTREAVRQSSFGEEDTKAALATRWALRTQRLLAIEPGLSGELSQVLEDALTALPPAERARIESTVRQAGAVGHGRVYQAGRDQRISEDGGQGRVGNTPPGPPLGGDDDEW